MSVITAGPAGRPQAAIPANRKILVIGAEPAVCRGIELS